MEKMSVSQRLHYLLKRYGKVAAGFYFVIGIIDLSCYYTAISMGLDVEPLLDSIFSMFNLDYRDYVSKTAGTFVAAYTIHKVK